MLQNLRLKSRMLILILGINIVMLVIVFGIYYGFVKKIIITETQQKAMKEVEGVKSNLEAYLEKKSEIAWTFCQDTYIKSWLKKNNIRRATRNTDPEYGRIIDQLKLYVKNDGDIRTAFIASQKTKWYYESAERPIGDDYNVVTRPWYKRTVQLGRLCYDVDVDVVDNTAAANIRIPIYDDTDGKLLGVGGVDFSLQFFNELVKKLGGVFKTGQSYLIGGDGKFYYHPDPEYILKGSINDFKDNGHDFQNLEEIKNKIKNNEKGISEIVMYGEKRYMIYTPIEKLGWSLVLSVSVGEINSPIIRLTRISMFIMIITVIFLTIAVLFITGTISRPVNNIVNMLKEIAEGEGDLTKKLNVSTKDEIGELAGWFNTFVDRVRSIVARVRENAGEVERTAHEMSVTSSEFANGIENQTAQLNEVVVSIQQMTTAIVENSKNAVQTAKVAGEASSKANEGAASMLDTKQNMDNIVETAIKTGDVINSLTNRAGQIEEIIQVINDIADQTNLLALNAAIEAARAGEQGRGFAVVADEVRKLAERTTKATAEVGSTIKAIQDDTKQVSESMQEVNRVVDSGKKATQKTEQVLNEITSAVTQAMDMINQIAAATEQMSTGAEQISKNINGISHIVNESKNGAVEIASAVEKLNRQSEILFGLVNTFKINDDETGVKDI